MMRSNDELCLVVVGRDGPVPVAVPVTGPDVGSAAGLAVALADVVEPLGPLGPLHCDRLGPLTDDSVGQLRDGDIVRPSPTISAAARLVAIGGPDAGTVWPLAPGVFTVGRGATAEIAVDDPQVSRAHAEFEVDRAGTVRVRDLGSTNGSVVDGVRIEGFVELDPRSVLEIGDTLLQVMSVGSAASVVPAGTGIAFNRPPRRILPPEIRAATLTAPAEQGARRRLPMAAILAPAVMGVAMAFLYGPAMLLLAFLSPVAYAWEHLAERRGDRKDHRAKVEAFRADVRAALAAAAIDATEAVRLGHEAAPGVGVIAGRALNHDPRLWDRRPTDPDFLSVRCGWGDVPTTGRLVVADQGDPQARAWAEEAVAPLSVERSAPVTIDLDAAGAVGVTGDPDQRDRAVAAMVLHIAGTHSPRDVVIAAAVDTAGAQKWGWLDLLPHTGAAQRVLDGRAVVDGSGADGLLARVATVAARRSATAQRDSHMGEAPRPLPRIVVVVDGDLVDQAVARGLLERLGASGVVCLWMAPTEEQLPGECGVVATVAAHRIQLRRTGRTAEPIRWVADLVGDRAATYAAAALAPYRDQAEAGDAGSLPAVVGLADLMGSTVDDAAVMAQRWATAPTGLHLTLGETSGGRCVLDLRVDGPHALVGGTTGAGKSELLQTIVGTLAATHSPERVSFLLIDYKGGAAFKDCVDLPHTAGIVTDLDPALSRRALIALDAELRRREHVLAAHGARDLIELERRSPDLAPPSLVIVVDEFATLVSELPDFVDGVVNVAQRGRSLGIHLVLATQRPAGAINDNVRANTNLRIALRMNDVDDSNDVIGTGAAAELNRSQAGRAFVRTGHGELTEVQVAFAGAVRSSAVPSAAVGARRLGPGGRPPSAEATNDDERTDLERLVATAGVAADTAGLRRPPSPWPEPLPPVLPLDQLGADQGDATAGFVIGRVDRPELQRQDPYLWRPAVDGSLLVLGAPGSGKTTVLRTLAAAIAARHPPQEYQFVVLDFAAGGLAAVAGLPHVLGASGADDHELTERLVRHLRTTVDERVRQFVAAGAADLDAHNRAVDQRLPRIVVLIDGFGAFRAAIESIEYGSLFDGLPALITDGRIAGVHFVIAASQRADVPMGVTGSIGRRLVLRVPEDEAAMIGLDMAVVRATSHRPGSAFDDDTNLVQIAVAGGPEPDVQAVTLARSGAAHAPIDRIRPFPAEVSLGDVGPPDGPWLGVGGPEVAPVAMPEGPIVAVGRPGAGVTNVLSVVAAAHARRHPGGRRILLSPRTPAPGPWTDVLTPASHGRDLGRALTDLVSPTDRSGTPMLVCVDDAGDLDDDFDLADWIAAARRPSDEPAVQVAIGARPVAVERGNAVVNAVRSEAAAVLLDVDVDTALMMGVDLGRRSGPQPPLGRATLGVDGRAITVQIALFDTIETG